MTTGQHHPAGQRQAFSLGQIAGRPAELVIAAALLVGSAIPVVIVGAFKINDVVDAFQLDSKPGLLALALLLIPVAVAVLQGLAGWMVFDADPLGRTLAFVIAGGWTLGMIGGEFRGFPGDSGTNGSFIAAMICALVAAVILMIGPEGMRAFRANAARRPNATVSGVRLSLIFAGVGLVFLGAVHIIAKSILQGDGKPLASGITMVILGLAAAAGSQLLATPQMEIRLGLTALGLAGFIVVLALGPRTIQGAILAGMVLIAPVLLWIVNDARAFYGEQPLSTGSQGPKMGGGFGGASGTTGQMPAQPTQQMSPHRAPETMIGSTPAAGGAACQSCGAVLSPDDAFCGSCGTRVPEPEPEPEPIAAAATGPRTCQNCGREAADDSKFCAGCGSPLPEPQPTCGGCGAALTPGDRFCPFCGQATGA